MISQNEDYELAFVRVIVNTVWRFMISQLFSCPAELKKAFPDGIAVLELKTQLDMDFIWGNESLVLDLSLESQFKIQKFALSTLDGHLYDFIYRHISENLTAHAILERGQFMLCHDTHAILNPHVFWNYLERKNPKVDLKRWKVLIVKAIEFREAIIEGRRRTVDSIREVIQVVVELLEILCLPQASSDVPQIVNGALGQ